MKVLICTFYFPPSGGGGVQRPLKFAQRLPEFGIETRVLAPVDARWIHRDEAATGLPDWAITRTPFFGPRGRLPAEELYGTHGLERVFHRARLFPRRLLIPDEDVSWALTAVPAIARLVKREQIDVLVTTSPPNSVHLIGAAAKRLTGVRWLADVRDSIVANHDRRIDNLAVRLKERTQGMVARHLARRADAIVTVTEQIANEMLELAPRGKVRTIANGADFDDVADLCYRPAPRFRITHTGSFFGKRDPRPFLTALSAVEGDLVARFVGDFRRADLHWLHAREMERKVELIPFVSRRRSLELQRDSELLLLLLPDVGARGRDVPSGKLYEYLAARRPILAAVPPDGSAARLIHEAGAGVVVAPDDVEAQRQALQTYHDRWQREGLADINLPRGFAEGISRSERVRELAEVLRELDTDRERADTAARP